MDKAELDEIRASVANEPENSPARRLLAEIDRRDEEDKQRQRASLKASLMGHHWRLTEEEAVAMMAHLDAVNARGERYEFEYEKGACRKCNAEGRVMTSSGCFGGHYEACSTCNGSGVDNHRLKVPGFTYECKCHPEWWEHFSRDRSRPRNHMEDCPKRRGPVEPKLPEAESEA